MVVGRLGLRSMLANPALAKRPAMSASWFSLRRFEAERPNCGRFVQLFSSLSISYAIDI
jgi:hypothetical protein